MVADRAAEQDRVARPGVRRRELHAVGDEADPGGVDEDAVGCSALDDLGISGDLPRSPTRTASTIRVSTSSCRPTSMKFSGVMSWAGTWSSIAFAPVARFTAVF
jgi:hypothetical protein